MEKTKKTLNDFYKELIELATANDRPDLVEFCEGRIALNSKKSSSKSPTKVQVENIAIKEIIVKALKEFETPVSISTLSTKEGLIGLSNQKISALLTQLKKEDLVIRTEDKEGVKFTAK